MRDSILGSWDPGILPTEPPSCPCLYDLDTEPAGKYCLKVLLPRSLSLALRNPLAVAGSQLFSHKDCPLLCAAQALAPPAPLRGRGRWWASLITAPAVASAHRAWRMPFVPHAWPAGSAGAREPGGLTVAVGCSRLGNARSSWCGDSLQGSQGSD